MREKLKGHWICEESYPADTPWDVLCTRKMGHKGKHRFTVKWRSRIRVYEPHAEDCNCMGCLIKTIHTPAIVEHLARSQRIIDFATRRAD